MDSVNLSELLGLGNKPQEFLMLWQDHLLDLSASLRESLAREDFKDVTLACDGQYMQAHKLVLSMCSPYLRTLFKVNPCQHPIIMLKNVRYKDLMAILQFMYQGEVNLQPEDLHGFFETAEMLQIPSLSRQDTSKGSKIQASPIKHEQSSHTVKEDKSVTPQTPQASPSVTPCKKMRTDNLQESEVDEKQFTNENVAREFAMPVVVEPVEDLPILSGEKKLFAVKYPSREFSEIEDTDGNSGLPETPVHRKLPKLGSGNTPQLPAGGTLSVEGLPDSDEHGMAGIFTAATSKTSLMQSKSYTVPKVPAQNSTAKNDSLDESDVEKGRKLGIPVISRVVKRNKPHTHSLSSGMEHNKKSSKHVNQAPSAENDRVTESRVLSDSPIITNAEDTQYTTPQPSSATVGKKATLSKKRHANHRFPGVYSSVSSDPTIKNGNEVTKPRCISAAVMKESEGPDAENISRNQPSSIDHSDNVYSFPSYALRNKEGSKHQIEFYVGPQAVTTFSCEKCDRVYTKRKTLQTHFRESHTGPYKCTFCGCIMQRQGNFTYHLKIKHNVKECFYKHLNEAKAFAAQDENAQEQEF